jgi:RNA polymerase sigma-70 factor (ECF subfamily)
MEMALQSEELTTGEAERLVEAQLARSFDDLAEAHALYEARVFRFLLYSVRDRDAAMTLTQDTFLAAWKARESFRGDCAPATWLLRIAVNQLRNHVRGERYKFWQRAATVDVTTMSEPLVDQAQSAEQQMASREDLVVVWKRVEKLSGRQRSVFLLRFVEEMELPEIAETMGQPLATVKTHLYRALDAVRTDLREELRRKR